MIAAVGIGTAVPDDVPLVALFAVEVAHPPTLRAVWREPGVAGLAEVVFCGMGVVVAVAFGLLAVAPGVGTGVARVHPARALARVERTVAGRRGMVTALAGNAGGLVVTAAGWLLGVPWAAFALFAPLGAVAAGPAGVRAVDRGKPVH
ncbi:hypothetical protein ACOBQX_15305 [Actinokineospora sp. G85]|uniref:hypothetical protein n=1 Tax=Actinokineospora sp. G85 TaxID=3406626 RepID=UPI003C709E08